MTTKFFIICHDWLGISGHSLLRPPKTPKLENKDCPWHPYECDITITKTWKPTVLTLVRCSYKPYLNFNTGLDLRKKPWSQLAPKFLDLVASTNFFIAKIFDPSGRKRLLEISAVQTVNTTFSSVRRKSKDEKPDVKKPLNVALLKFHYFHWPVIKNIYSLQDEK